MAGADQYHVADFIEAIPGTGGIITTIARRVGCNWHTAKKYIEKHATVEEAYEAEKERVLDKAETNVIAPIMEQSDVDTSKWYLTMKGAERGYATKHKQEISGPDGGPVIVVDWEHDAPDDPD